MKYLLTGATGELGTYALDYLKKTVPTEDIAVFVRSEEKAQPFRDQGLDARIGEFGNADSLADAFKGIDRLLFISSQPGQEVSRGDQHTNVVNAAKEAGISFIAYTSFSKGAESKSALAQDHILTEQLITESGITHAFLRNNWYLENEIATLQAALVGEPFAYAAGEGKVGWALKREYAEAAVNILTQAQPTSTVYELAGPLLTYAELAEALTTASGKSIDVKSMTNDDYKEMLTSNSFPKGLIGFLSMLQADISQGELEVESTDLEKALGKPLTPMVDALKEVLELS